MLPRPNFERATQSVERDLRAARRSVIAQDFQISELERQNREQIIDIEDMNTRLDETTRQLNEVRIRDMANHRGPNLPIPEFHGENKDNFDQWMKQFNLLFKANGFDERVKPDVLVAKLRGRAFLAYDALDDATKSNFDNLVTRLTATFCSSDRTRHVHQRYETRKQGDDETVGKFGCELYELGMTALSDVPEPQRDSLIRTKFMEGLNAELNVLVTFSNPKTFQEALTLAERLEGLKTAKNPDKQTLVLLEQIADRMSKLEAKDSVNEIN